MTNIGVGASLTIVRSQWRSLSRPDPPFLPSLTGFVIHYVTEKPVAVDDDAHRIETVVHLFRLPALLMVDLHESSKPTGTCRPGDNNGDSLL